MDLKLNINKYLSGSGIAAKAIYQSTYKILFAIALRYVIQEDAAKDVLQESYVKIYKNLDRVQFNSDTLALAWMKKICVNESLMHIRKKGNWDKLQISLAPKTTLLTTSIEKKESLSILLSLPMQQRICFSLFALEGYSHKEISQQLNIKESHSRTLVTRARKQLASKITTARNYETS